MVAQTSTYESRWQEIISIWKNNQWLFVFAGWLLGLITFPAIELATENTDIFE